jgi:hypothetical protein
MCSKEFGMSTGVRQGRVLSPLIFIILIDETEKNLREKMKSAVMGIRHLR